VSVGVTGTTFEPGAPKPIVRVQAPSLSHAGGDYHLYDVSGDGQRFLIFQQVLQTVADTGDVSPDEVEGFVMALNAIRIRK